MSTDIFRLLQTATKGNHIVQENIPTKLSDRVDPFENQKDQQLVVMKTKILLRGHGGKVRRAYVKCPNALDYRYVGWVFDDDVDNCMICGADFAIFRRRHHCRVCGNIICASCSTGSVRIKEIHEYDKVRACDNCYIGQEEISIKPLDASSSSALNSQLRNISSNSSISTQNEQFSSSSSVATTISLSSAAQQQNRNSKNTKRNPLASLQQQVYRYQIVLLIAYIILYILVLQINK